VYQVTYQARDAVVRKFLGVTATSETGYIVSDRS